MISKLLPFYVLIGLLFGILACLEIGWRIGKRDLASGDVSMAGISAMDGAVFALLGLFIAFTFSAAVTRFESRRQTVVEETNAIGTAWLRLDLLPPDIQPGLKELFRRYTDSRIAVYRYPLDQSAVNRELAARADLQNDIWAQAVSAARSSPNPTIAMAVLPPLNQMFDIATTRTMSAKMHTPIVVFILLFALSLVSAIFAGYNMASEKKRNWLHMIGFVIVLAVSVFMIVDLEFPRLGIIRIDKAFDQAMIDLRASMK
jgi:membrane associated rhomboid family serine protease